MKVDEFLDAASADSFLDEGAPAPSSPIDHNAPFPAVDTRKQVMGVGRERPKEGGFLADIPRAARNFAPSLSEGVQKTGQAVKLAAADWAESASHPNRDDYWDEGIRPANPAGPANDRAQAIKAMDHIDLLSQQRRQADPYNTVAGEMLGGAVESTGYMLPGVAAAVATRSPYVMAGALGARTGIDAYGEKRQEGEGKGAALAHGAVSGAAETVFEMLPAKILFDLFGKKAGKNLAFKVAKYMGAEQLTEIPTTLVQNASDILFSSAGGEAKAAAYAEQYVKAMTGQESVPVVVGEKTFDARHDLIMTMGQTAFQSGIMGGAAKGYQLARKAIGGESKDVDLLDPEDGFDVNAYLDGAENDLSTLPEPRSEVRQEVPELQSADAQVAPESAALAPGAATAPQDDVGPAFERDAVPTEDDYAGGLYEGGTESLPPLPGENREAGTLSGLRKAAEPAQLKEEPNEEALSELQLHPGLPGAQVPGVWPDDRVDAAAHEAATSPLNKLPQPSEAMKEAGNYKKGHVRVAGLDISIENPKGSKRSGTAPDGTPWETEMANHYGYIRGTKGKDKDHLDVFFASGVPGEIENSGVVVIDQIDPQTGKFDEHKIILGARGKEDGVAAYLANYDEKGREQVGAATEMPMAEFKEWLKSGKTTRPVAYKPEPAQDVANLYSGIPLPELKKLAGNVKAAMPILMDVGQRAYQSGARTLDTFKTEMKRALGELYDRFKDAMIRVFNDVKARLKDQRGMVGTDIGKPDLLSEARRQIKEGKTSDAVLKSLREAYKNSQGKEREALLRAGKEYAAAHSKPVSEKKATAPPARSKNIRSLYDDNEQSGPVVSLSPEGESRRALTEKEIAEKKKNEEAAQEVSPKEMTDERRQALHREFFEKQVREDRSSSEGTTDDFDMEGDYSDDAIDFEDRWFPANETRRQTTDLSIPAADKREKVAFEKIRTNNQIAASDKTNKRGRKMTAEDHAEMLETEKAQIEKLSAAAAQAYLYVRGKLKKNAELSKRDEEIRNKKTGAVIQKRSEPFSAFILRDLARMGETHYLPDLVEFIEKQDGSFGTMKEYPNSMIEFDHYQQNWKDYVLEPKATREQDAAVVRDADKIAPDLASILRGIKKRLSPGEATRNAQTLKILATNPKAIQKFLQKNPDASVEQFTTEIAPVTEKLLEKLQELSWAEILDGLETDALVKEESGFAEQIIAESDHKTAIPRRKVKKRAEETRRESMLDRQYQLFLKAGRPGRLDAPLRQIAADNFSAFFEGFRKTVESGGQWKTQAQKLSWHKLEANIKPLADAEFKALRLEERIALVKDMFNATFLTEGTYGKELRRKDSVENRDGLSEYPGVAENLTAELVLDDVGVAVEGAYVADASEEKPAQLKLVNIDERNRIYHEDRQNTMMEMAQAAFDKGILPKGVFTAYRKNYREMTRLIRVRNLLETEGKYGDKEVSELQAAKLKDGINESILELRKQNQPIELPLKVRLAERNYRLSQITDPKLFEKIKEKTGTELSPAELYDAYLKGGGNIARVYALINQKQQEQRQTTVDKNHEAMKEQRKKKAAARRIATAHLDAAQKRAYGSVAEDWGRKNAAWRIMSHEERAVVSAAMQIEQSLASGETEIADIKLDHGLPVFPEDVFRRELEENFEAGGELDGVMTGKLRNPVAQKFYEAVAKAFGAKLAVVSDPSYRSRYDGATGTIVVNIQEDRAIHRVFAHELFHHVVNRADPSAYKAFVAAIKGMVGPERWDAAQLKFGRSDMDSALSSLTEEGEGRVDEEMLADLFSEVFTQDGFYEVLAKSLPGRTLAQKLIDRLLAMVRKVTDLFASHNRWGYEETQLLGPRAMRDVQQLLGGLISTMGERKHGEERYFGTFGIQPANIKASLSPLMGKIFPEGAGSTRKILDAVENAVGLLRKQAEKGARLIFADVGAAKPVIRLANQLVYTANTQEQKFDAQMGKHEAVFDDWVKGEMQALARRVENDLEAKKIQPKMAALVLKTNRNYFLEKLHDDWVRMPLSEEQLKKKYPAAMHAAFKDMKTMGDEIAAKLEEIDPDFVARENHFMQSLRWHRITTYTVFMEKDGKKVPRKTFSSEAQAVEFVEALREAGDKSAYTIEKKKSVPMDDSFAGVLDRSRLEGDKHMLKTKDTTRSTAKIREEGFEYKTIDPMQLARQYVRDSYQLIAFRQMVKDGLVTETGDGLMAARVFATPNQANRAGYQPVNDTGTEIMMKLNLAVGYRVKLSAGYLKENGSEQVYGTAEEAQRKADAYTESFGEEARVEAVEGQQRVTEGPQWLIAAVDREGNRTEWGKRFESKAAAEDYAIGRHRYDAQGTYVGEGGTHTKDGQKLVAEKEKLAPTEVSTARIYFHPHLARMINRAIAPNPLLSGQFGKVGKTAMKVKNEMTTWEFAFSLFHFVTIGQELMASTATWNMKQGKGVAGWARSFLPWDSYRDAQRIASLFDVVAKDPSKAQDPAIQKELGKLLAVEGVDPQAILEMYGMSGGLMQMDTSIQASTHSMGKMRYRNQSHQATIQDGKVVFTGDRLLSRKAIAESIQKVYEKELAKQPDAKVKAAFSAGRFALANGTADWLMQYAIPRIKMAMWAREYTLALEKKKAQIAAGTVKKEDVAHETMIFIEDRFGEVNWQSMWLEPWLKTALQFTFRSFTWVFGNFTGLAKAGADITKWGWFNVARGKLRSEDRYELTEKGWWGINAMVGHMLTVGALTTFYQLAVLGGDEEAPDEEGVPLLSKLLFPRMDPLDPGYRLQFGSYVTESYKIFSHLGAFGNEVEISKMFSGRLSSVIAQGFEAFWHGTDWRGVAITQHDDQPQTKLAKKLLHTLSFAPISLSSAKSQWERKGFEPEKAAIALMGFTEAPAAAKRSPATNTAFAIRREENSGQMVEEDVMAAREELQRAIHAYGKGEDGPLKELIQEGRTSKTRVHNAMKRLPLIKGQPNPAYVNPLAQAIQGLKIDGALRVWEEMTDLEKRKHRPKIIEKYYNMERRTDRSPVEKKRIRDEMKKLGIF